MRGTACRVDVRGLAAALLSVALALVGELAFASDVSRVGEAIRDCADCPEMIVIPAGRVQVGSVARELQDEGSPLEVRAMEVPRHPVVIRRPIAVGRFEVTRREYAAFVNATGRTDGENCFVWNTESTAWEKTAGVTWRSPGFSQADDEPAVCVSWEDARDYARWLAGRTGKGYRLLSEAEWEYAARAGGEGVRPWASGRSDGRADACRYANVSDQDRVAVHRNPGADPQASFGCRDGYVFTAPVGRFRPNAFGLFDMIGNVWEWTEDCEHPDYVGAPADGRPWLTGDCGQRSNRGGSWGDPMWRVRSALREWDPPGGRYVINGIRVARELE